MENSDEGWTKVNSAWDRVFVAIGQLGNEIGSTYRDTYRQTAAESETYPSPADAGKNPDSNMADMSDSIGKSLSAARSAFDASMNKLSESDTPQTLSRDVESAVKTSLAQLGETFTRLSEQMGNDKPDEPQERQEPQEPS